MRSTVHETLSRSKSQRSRSKWSCNVVAQKHRTYAVNVIRLWKCICIIGNRCRRSEWRGHIFDRKFQIAVTMHARWKYAQNSLTVLSNRHNFSPFKRNRGRWTRRWGQFSDRKQNLRYFCACALKKSSKHSKNVFWQKTDSPVTGNWGSPKRKARSDFWPEARK